ncbi:MAG: carbohydrate ABC transporter permease [Anaerolineae bacterium]|nr:carbohydrate ABC transporter permease [Anaerolineae bacterium]MDQ7037261.1 carbohydrate ABC transporter permease [Anaerolineae bacterium]
MVNQTNSASYEKKSFIDHLAASLSWQRFLLGVGLFMFLAMILFPFYWMVSSSFKARSEIGGRNPVYIPSELRLDAYQELFNPNVDHFQDFGTNILNSVRVAFPTAILTVIIATLGAYAVARLRFSGKEFLINSVLIVYLFPAVLLIIPLFAMLSSLSETLGFQVQDNLIIIIFTYLAQTLPVAIYMLTSYFRTIPAEIEQAAQIDGCSRFEVIWRITLPLSVPALVTVGLYTFMIAWNELLYALIFLNSRDLFTMPIKINTIFNDPSNRLHTVMAASTIMTLPVIILFLSFERFLEQGLTSGSVKG